MPECSAEATWNGTVMEGEGDVELESGVWAGEYATAGTAGVTDPEELLAAAHASCFAMTVAWVLADAGYTPESVDAESVVTIEFGDEALDVTGIDVTVTGTIPDATDEEFASVVEQAERACPVSKALDGTDIEVSVPSAA